MLKKIVLYTLAAIGGLVLLSFFIGTLGLIYEDFQNNKEFQVVKADNMSDANAQFEQGKIYFYGCEIPKDKFGNDGCWHSHLYINSNIRSNTENMITYYFPLIIPRNDLEPTQNSEIVQDHKKAAECLTRAAKQGHAESQVMLSLMYRSSDGVLYNSERYIFWLTKAAEGGLVDAQLQLATHYLLGEFAPQDDNLAVKWYTKAAEQGSDDAQLLLGVLYLYGQGVPQNDTQAVAWFTEAAKQEFRPFYSGMGIKCAQYNLGLMYLDGRGVERNRDQAISWLTKAAENDTNIQYKLALLYNTNLGMSVWDVVGQKLAEVHKAQYLHWLNRAAEGGHVKAQNSLGFYYTYSEKDVNKALGWFLKAAEKGDVSSMFSVGRIYYEDEYALNDKKQASIWFTKAAEKGDTEAQVYLFVMYANGQGVSQDSQEAEKWLAKATETAKGKATLASMYYSGRGVSQDYQMALKWYTKAAEEGDSGAQLNLGGIYKEGQGVRKDYKEALKWYMRAAESYENPEYVYEYIGDLYSEGGNGLIEDYTEAYKWYLVAGSKGVNFDKDKDLLREKMTPEQLAEAQSRAKAFIEQVKTLEKVTK